jgi:E3 SUMO-protein ligase PIAS1
MQHHRHTVKINLRASDHVVLQTLKHDSSHRVYVFCAADKDGQQEIAFPHQSEIKVNTGEIKANLRGLKNKPGSTRPVDITKELRYTPITYSNAIEMTYALTTKVAPGTSHVRCQIHSFSLPLYSLELFDSRKVVKTKMGIWHL